MSSTQAQLHLCRVLSLSEDNFNFNFNFNNSTSIFTLSNT